MNKQVLKFGIRRMIVLAGLVGTFSFSGFAATNKGGKDAASAVQYVGTNDQGVVFDVKYENVSAAPFSLIIKNEYGDVVYQQQYNDKNFDKKVLLTKEPGDARLTFIIRSASANIKQSFDISTTTKTVEEVVVKNAQ
ncbi:MAG: hypothetical protein M3R72_00040 [Bacteroidota bacterium]|nr:hypothetical protein [Bacteroidota bacterium]